MIDELIQLDFALKDARSSSNIFKKLKMRNLINNFKRGILSKYRKKEYMAVDMIQLAILVDKAGTMYENFSNIEIDGVSFSIEYKRSCIDSKWISIALLKSMNIDPDCKSIFTFTASLDSDIDPIGRIKVEFEYEKKLAERYFNVINRSIEDTILIDGKGEYNTDKHIYSSSVIIYSDMLNIYINKLVEKLKERWL